MRSPDSYRLAAKPELLEALVLPVEHHDGGVLETGDVRVGALGQRDQARVALAERAPHPLVGADDQRRHGRRGDDGGRGRGDERVVLAVVPFEVHRVAGDEARRVQQRVALGPPQADLELARPPPGHVRGGDLAHPPGGGAGQVLARGVAQVHRVRQLAVLRGLVVHEVGREVLQTGSWR